MAGLATPIIAAPTKKLRPRGSARTPPKLWGLSGATVGIGRAVNLVVCTRTMREQRFTSTWQDLASARLQPTSSRPCARAGRRRAATSSPDLKTDSSCRRASARRSSSASAGRRVTAACRGTRSRCISRLRITGTCAAKRCARVIRGRALLDVREAGREKMVLLSACGQTRKCIATSRRGRRRHLLRRQHPLSRRPRRHGPAHARQVGASWTVPFLDAASSGLARGKTGLTRRRLARASARTTRRAGPSSGLSTHTRGIVSCTRRTSPRRTLRPPAKSCRVSSARATPAASC
mmetsp:Transcript_37389/g.102714  ORF Transcript_37389/g.102714 Transcript_37389/m.102714 type:complete len:292 (+) Transcript_37389:358-1233(+)